MDIEIMPHAMYFTGNSDTVTKINQVPYQTIQYNENGMFTAKLMNDTPIEIFIDNGATPSILPLRTYNKFPILHTYPKTESNTPIHTGGGMITSHKNEEHKNAPRIKRATAHQSLVKIYRTKIDPQKSWIFLCHFVAFCSQIQNIQLFLKRHYY